MEHIWLIHLQADSMFMEQTGAEADYIFMEVLNDDKRKNRG